MSNQSIHEFKEAMNIIKSRGIVKTNSLNSNAIYRYDFNTGKFNPYSKEQLRHLFNRLYLNSYDVNYSIQNIIDELTPVDFKKVKNYYTYQNIKGKAYNLEDLEKRLDSYLECNKMNKKEVRTILWSLQSQLQQLINNDVFTDGKVLCKFDNKTKRFDSVSPKDLMRLFFKNAEHKENLSAIGLANNYLYFVDNLTNIGSLREDFSNYHIIENCKSDYDVICDLINSFN